MRLALFALCLAACAPEASEPPPPTAVVQQPAQAGTPPIRGEWRLVEMNGKDAADAEDAGGPPEPIIMTAGEATFRARSQCVVFWRRYEWREGRLVVTPANPGPMCARGLTDWETEFSRTLSAVTAADMRNDALRLSGPAASLTFQPAPPPARESFAGRWRLRFVHGAAPPAGEPPLEITVTDDEITANACVFPDWRYRQDGNLLEVAEIPTSVCERTLTAFEQRFAVFMRGLSRATVVQDGALILDSASEQLEFRRIE